MKGIAFSGWLAVLISGCRAAAWPRQRTWPGTDRATRRPSDARPASQIDHDLRRVYSLTKSWGQAGGGLPYYGSTVSILAVPGSANARWLTRTVSKVLRGPAPSV